MNRNTKRLLFLFSDTGGGHRSSALAVAQALRDLYGERAQVELVDVLADFAPWPLNHLGAVYPYMVRLRGWPWAAGYRLFDGPRRIGLFTGSLWPLVRTSLLQLLREYPADVILSCHPATTHLLTRLLAETGA